MEMRGLEPLPTVADIVSAPSGRLRSLSCASMRTFPKNAAHLLAFLGAHFGKGFNPVFSSLL